MTASPTTLLEKFVGALKQISPFSPPQDDTEILELREKFRVMGEESENRKINDKLKETVLFLVLENTPPKRNSSKWDRACVVTDMEVLPSAEKEGKLEAENFGIRLRAMYRDIPESERETFRSVKAGQWVECVGHYGGPLLDDFFPQSIKIRTDLASVPQRDLPHKEQVHDVISRAFADEHVAPLTFKAR